MGPEATRKARMAVLNEEMDSIHYANKLFWEQKKTHSHEASVEYYRRQDRLEEIRSELAVLTHYDLCQLLRWLGSYRRTRIKSMTKTTAVAR